MDAIEISRTFSYLVFSAYAVQLSLKNGRMFGIGSMVIFSGFSFRMGASLVLGWDRPSTSMISTVGVMVCWAAMLWDMYSDFKKFK